MKFKLLDSSKEKKNQYTSNPKTFSEVERYQFLNPLLDGEVSQKELLMETHQDNTKTSHVPILKIKMALQHGGRLDYQNLLKLLLFRFTTEKIAAPTDLRTSRSILETTKTTLKTMLAKMERNSLEVEHLNVN